MNDACSPKSGAGGTDDWLSLLDELRVEFAVLSAPGDSYVMQLMQLHGGWGVRCQDGDAVLLARLTSGGDEDSVSRGR